MMRLFILLLQVVLVIAARSGNAIGDTTSRQALINVFDSFVDLGMAAVLDTKTSQGSLSSNPYRKAMNNNFSSKLVKTRDGNNRLISHYEHEFLGGEDAYQFLYMNNYIMNQLHVSMGGEYHKTFLAYDWVLDQEFLKLRIQTFEETAKNNIDFTTGIEHVGTRVQQNDTLAIAVKTAKRTIAKVIGNADQRKLLSLIVDARTMHTYIHKTYEHRIKAVEDLIVNLGTTLDQTLTP